MASSGALSALRSWVDEERALSDLHKLRARLAKSKGTLEYIDILIEAGIPADVGRQLTFEGREFWRPIYKALWGPSVAVQSASQVGKTIMLFHGAHSLGHLFYYQRVGIWHGLYMPTREMVATFSKGRLGPILSDVGEKTGVGCGDVSPEAFEEALARAGKKRAGKRPSDTFNFKQIALSYLYLAWVNGTLVDALPLDVAWVDEVRLILEPSRVDRIEERIQASKIGWLAFTSTAGLPGDAMSVRWEQSDQRRWHHPCNCPDGVDLAMAWPNCLGERSGANIELEDRFYLYCPRCGVEVTQRNAGRWIAMNPGGIGPGFSPNQLMTDQPLWKIAMAWRRPDRDTAQFYNGRLGLTYLDRTACPIDLDVLNACVNEDVLWARPGDVTRTAMGIDQMGGVNYYVIAKRTDSGKRRIVHLEIDFRDDPFSRAAELMDRYDVSICCVESLPNYNDAVRFANAFPRRVFLVHYAQIRDGKNPIVWNDLDQESDGVRVVDADVKTRFSVKVEQVKLFDALATHWRERLCEVPNPRTLMQRVPHQHGGELTVEVCWQVYFDHLQRIAKRKVTEKKTADGVEMPEETGVVRYHIGKLPRSPSGTPPAPVKGAANDPHFAFTDMLCWLAWTRLTVSNWTPTVLWV